MIEMETPSAWRTLGGEIRNLSQAVFDSEHTLIAGTTGCGKSTLENAIIGDLLKSKSPSQARLVLIDPKRLELGQYRGLPHTVKYADTVDGAIAALNWCVGEMNRRYAIAQSEGVRSWSGSHIYIMIDELVPLMVSQKRGEISNLLSLILTQGRASGFHVVACTQCPNREILNKQVKPLFDTKIGMRCAEAIESREVVGTKGCENLPRHGLVLVRWHGSLHEVSVPMTDYKEIDMLIHYWKSSACVA